MVKKILFVLFLVIFLGLVSLNFISSEINVTGCSGPPLNESNTLYQLNQSINATGEDCLMIGNHSIVLDCAGYNITLYGANEDNWSAVLTIPNFNNITVKNCTFAQNFTGVNQSAVGFINSANSTIFNNTMTSGILLDGSLNTNISGNIINNSAGIAIILLSGSNSSVIENNNITTVSMGISVEESHNINISSNNLTSTGAGIMIRLEGSDWAIINYNIITTSSDGASGVITEDAFDVIVDLNVITTSGEEAFGIILDGNDINITSNNITTSGYHSNGINLQGTDDSIVTQNIIQTADADACVINIGMSGYNNILYDNIFNTSSTHPGACLDNALANIWNTTEQVGTNIINGPNLGGNFWTNNASTGYSDTCLDEDGNYICDDQYNLTLTGTLNIDYLPLANHTNMISGCGTLDVANETYALNQSITEISGMCFNISANNITLNLQGKNITGDGTGYGINITGYNDTTLVTGMISNFSNGIYISSGSNNAFSDLTINNSVQDAILLTGDTSDNNNFTRITVLNTNASYYDINFSTEGIDGTWIEDISGFENYTFAGLGGKVNFKEPTFGEIKFIEAINGSGTSLHTDVDIESNWVFVNGSKSGLNKSANISLYSISYTDPKPQYSSDNSVWTNCTTSTDPACSELSFSGNSFVFNTTHFTYFRSIESSVADEDDTPSGGAGTTPYWTMTYVVDDEQFEEGYTKELAIKSRMKVMVGTNYHYVGVVDLSGTTVTVNVSSDIMQVILSVGDEAKFDVNDNGFYDIYVLLNAIANNKADLTVQKIHEEIPEGEGKVRTTGEVTDGEEVGEEERNLIWLWVLVATVIVVLILVGVGIAKKRKQ